MVSSQRRFAAARLSGAYRRVANLGVAGVLGAAAVKLSRLLDGPHPDRAESLILLGGYARLRTGDGYPGGVAQAHIDQISEMILTQWGGGADLDFTNPSKAGDASFRRWYATIQRMSASPATACRVASGPGARSTTRCASARRTRPRRCSHTSARR